MTDFGKQVDVVFKIKAALRGGHVHCALFSKPRAQFTWQKCGDFVIGADSITSFVSTDVEWQWEEN